MRSVLYFSIYLVIESCVGAAWAQEADVNFYSAGYKAGVMCSGVFVAGRAPEDVLRDELGGKDLLLTALADPVVDRASRSVTCEVGDGQAPRLAVYREGYGCVLLPPDSTLEDASMLPQVEIPKPQGDPEKIAWPDGDLLSDTPTPSEVDTVKLAAALESVFQDAESDRYKTLGVVVVYKNQIVAERYAPTWGIHTQYRSWSSAKSITNALVGILVGDGKLDPKAPAPIPEWGGEGDTRATITLENLMRMSSGLDSPGASTFRGYWGGVDTAERATALTLKHEPGTYWKYSNYDTLLLVRSIKEVLPDQAAYLTFPRRALLNKIGMRDTQPEIDPFGNYILSSQVYTTPRDLARLGLFYLHDGVWNGERILPEGWVEYSRTPAPAKKVRERQRGYGAQFWLIDNDDRVPADTYTTSGSRGQYSTIVPSRDLVVARTGLDPRTLSSWDQAAFVSSVLAAIEDD